MVMGILAIFPEMWYADAALGLARGGVPPRYSDFGEGEKTLTNYDFWFAPFNGEPFLCTIERIEGCYGEYLNAAARAWEALTPFGNPVTRHPITGETPDEFRARSNT